MQKYTKIQSKSKKILLFKYYKNKIPNIYKIYTNNNTQKNPTYTQHTKIRKNTKIKQLLNRINSSYKKQ